MVGDTSLSEKLRTLVSSLLLIRPPMTSIYSNIQLPICIKVMTMAGAPWDLSLSGLSRPRVPKTWAWGIQQINRAHNFFFI
jgi:hypothetical protein